MPKIGFSNTLTGLKKTMSQKNGSTAECENYCFAWSQLKKQHYSNLKHRRTVFFVDKKYFVLVDEAVGIEVIAM